MHTPSISMTLPPSSPQGLIGSIPIVDWLPLTFTRHSAVYKTISASFSSLDKSPLLGYSHPDLILYSSFLDIKAAVSSCWYYQGLNWVPNQFLTWLRRFLIKGAFYCEDDETVFFIAIVSATPSTLAHLCVPRHNITITTYATDKVSLVNSFA